jgi:hypothetical protein
VFAGGEGAIGQKRVCERLAAHGQNSGGRVSCHGRRQRYEGIGAARAGRKRIQVLLRDKIGDFVLRIGRGRSGSPGFRSALPLPHQGDFERNGPAQGNLQVLLLPTLEAVSGHLKGVAGAGNQIRRAEYTVVAGNHVLPDSQAVVGHHYRCVGNAFAGSLPNGSAYGSKTRGRLSERGGGARLPQQNNTCFPHETLKRP